MKTITLRIGKKGAREPVKVPLQVPETLADIATLTKQNEAVAIRCFRRGWQIENQERSGARDAFGEGQTEAQIAKIVADYDPTKTAERGPRVVKPKTIVIPKGKKSFSAEDLRALLQSQGVVVADEEPAAAGA